jgi:hypothetical protein
VSSGECPTCGLKFAGDDSFDRHRVPLPRHEDPDPPTNRCLTLEEMQAGLPMVGDLPTPWRQNSYGHWTHRELPPGDAIAGLQIDPGSPFGGSSVSEVEDEPEEILAQSAGAS